MCSPTTPQRAGHADPNGPRRFVNRVTFFIADVVRLHGVGGLILLEHQPRRQWWGLSPRLPPWTLTTLGSSVDSFRKID